MYDRIGLTILGERIAEISKHNIKAAGIIQRRSLGMRECTSVLSRDDEGVMFLRSDLWDKISDDPDLKEI